MPVYETYSMRLRRERGDPYDVVTYDEMSPKLRTQFGFIVTDLLGEFTHSTFEVYENFVLSLRRTFGMKQLATNSHDYGAELTNFIGHGSVEHVLDAMDMLLRIAHEAASNAPLRSRPRTQAEGAIDEFNQRCKLAGFGFAFEDGQMMRVDSQFLHAEAVKPALTVLRDPAFSNADAEFRNAHDHWRAGKKPEVLVDCLKAFESVMKVIAHQRGWPLPDGPTASQLVNVMLANKLIPAFYQTHMAGLRSVLESGIPTPRNRAGGHGAGPGPEAEVPDELVRYVLNLTAATILYLVDAHKSRP